MSAVCCDFIMGCLRSESLSEAWSPTFEFNLAGFGRVPVSVGFVELALPAVLFLEQLFGLFRLLKALVLFSD